MEIVRKSEGETKEEKGQAEGGDCRGGGQGEGGGGGRGEERGGWEGGKGRGEDKAEGRDWEGSAVVAQAQKAQQNRGGKGEMGLFRGVMQ